MHRRLQSVLRLAVLVFGTCSLSAAFQTQVYVDAVGGDDTHSGFSETDAFRTLTAATTAFPSGDLEFVVAPGLYDTAHGESFPIEIRHGATIRYYALPSTRRRAYGSQVGPRPVIDAGGAPIALKVAGEDALKPWTGSFNVVVQNAERGIVIRGMDQTYFGRGLSGFTIRDCAIGVDVIQDPQPGLTYVGFEYCTFEGCRIGVRLAGRAHATFYDSTFRGMSVAGLMVGDVEYLQVYRTAFTECKTGLSLDAGPSTAVTQTLVGLKQNLFAKCQSGLLLREGTPGRLSLLGQRLTFADNGIGVETLAAPGGAPFTSASIVGCIFSQNGVGLAAGQAGFRVDVSVSHASGPIGGNDIVSFDPEFRDRSAGDYRLSPTSQAVDRYSSGAPSSVLENMDGDLNLVLREDYGAFEFAPLDRQDLVLDPQLVRIGDSLELEIAGTPGGAAMGLVQPGIANTSIMSVYGRLLLDPGYLARGPWRDINGASGLATWTVTIPNDPALIDTTLNLQALTSSTLAPTGLAFTNALYLTLIP